MATYMMLKVDFQKLSEIEIFRKSKDRGWMLIWIINMSSWCYIWCWKQHSIIVAHFQQKCCFSATNVDFSWLFILIHVKIGNQTKKQHLSRASHKFLDDLDAINDGWSNRTSLLLIFNKNVVFRQQMLFFRLISNFYMH